MAIQLLVDKSINCQKAALQSLGSLSHLDYTKF